MLRVEGLTVQFGGVKPLDDVTLRFEGGVCGLVGPNGAGKTTLFNVLSGFVIPVRGRVHAGDGGVDVLALPPHRRARWGLRRTFQQEQIVQELTAEENVALAVDHLGGGGRGWRSKAEELLNFVRLQAGERRGSELPMLDRRKVELAKALAGEPKLVLLDEPGAGLSEDESRHLGDIVRAIPESFGAHVVLVDHDMELVGYTCQTTAVLDFGRLIALGPTRDVLNDPAVKAAYMGTQEIA